MSSFYFDYDIKNALNSKQDVCNDLKLFIEKQFDSNTNAIKYVLSLVIRREVELDAQGQIISQSFPNPAFKYIHIVHDKKADYVPIKSLMNADNVNYYVDKFNVGVVDENRKEINKKYRYIKYTFNDLNEDEISGFGYIGFTTDQNVESLVENRYYYFCNFTRKEEIWYKIENRGSKLRIEINVPVIKDKIDLNVAFSDAPTYLLQNFFNSVVTITKNDSGKTVVKTINNEQPNKCYKLAFKDLSLNNYLILVKSEVDKGFSLTEKVFDQGTKLYCPFCLEPIGKYCLNRFEKLKHQYTVFNCSSNAYECAVYENDKLVKERIIYCDNYYNIDGSKVHKLLLPKDYIYTNNKIISILGLPASGKSVFLSTLLGLQNGEVADLSYLNAFLKKFNFTFNLDYFKSLGIDELSTSSRALNLYKHQSYIPISDDSNESFEEELSFDEQTMYDDFRIDFSRVNFLRTNTERHFLPFILTSNKTNIILSDIAGEDAKKLENITPEEAKEYGIENKSKKVNLANGYVLLVSPQDSNFEETFKRVLNEDNKNIPIAVVLSKFDEIDTSKFDPSCACLRDDTYQMVLNSYEGSLLKLNIDQSSLEIRDFIKQNIPNVPINELDKFTNVRYFVTSSIGDKSCAVSTSTKGEGAIMFYNTPFRIELPLIWILYHMGIIS